ncbi:MAG: RecX family transcriptional regulator [Thermomicrobiales bacterium]|nr:RecX family transcriptional regulator [Thermomicrobiales bacterium]MCO5218386.1 RecX family transcriptional regulator [Thermomicrobiales bacterium]MCO5227106.1 RecX family transcriptional regulator [Thermomicrobiales bacterium]
MNRRRDRAPAEPPKPGTITSMAPQARDADRLNISIDGVFAFGIHVDIAANHYLRVGQVLTADMLQILLDEDEIKKATLAALNLIAYRPRASGELTRKLREKGYRSEAADAAVARMQELGYLNDADFADRWIENRQEHRPRSRRMLQQELREKGIDAETIAEVMDEAEIDEFSDALALAQKKAAGMTALDVETRQRRISGFLSRRGYGFDVIRRVLEEIG